MIKTFCSKFVRNGFRHSALDMDRQHKEALSSECLFQAACFWQNPLFVKTELGKILMAVQFCQQLFTAALLNIKRRRQLSRKDLVVVLLSFYFKYMKLEICGFKKIKKLALTY